VAIGGDQALGRGGQRRQRTVKVIVGRAQRAHIPVSGEQTLLRGTQGVPRRKQRLDVADLRPDDLVDRPGGHGRLLEGGNLARLLATSLGPERLGQRRPLQDELLERQPVELIDVHPYTVAIFAPPRVRPARLTTCRGVAAPTGYPLTIQFLKVCDRSAVHLPAASGGMSPLGGVVWA
jgi:hypothetical protein